MGGNIIHKTGGISLALATIFSLLFGFALNSYAQESDSSGTFNHITEHVKRGELLLTAEYSLTISSTDYATSSTVSSAWRGMGKYIFPIYNQFYFGPGLFIGTGTLTGADVPLENDPRGFPGQFRTPISYVGLGLEISYKAGPNLNPYVFLSLTELFFQPEDIFGKKLPNNAKGSVYSTKTLEPGIEAGVRYFVSDKIALNASATYYLFPNDYLDDLKKGAANDKYSTVNFGFTYAPLANGQKFEDNDADGIEDGKDMCPGTPKNIRVDEFGCPLDSDNDRIPDYLDKCPNTSAGVKVDSSGCPLDSDKDDVPDYLDKCPNTSPGLKVDAAGCPIDFDQDGVPDYLDKCPNTPAGTNVDSTGCPVKTTPPETQKPPETNNENENVRIIPPSELKSVVLYMDTYFGPNKEKLLPKAHTLLDILANTMKGYPNSRWEINGYTDSTGIDKQNLEISKKAAQTVADYLIGKGVNPQMMKVTGYGERNPIYSNDFSEGRALNRRVEIKYVSGQ